MFILIKKYKLTPAHNEGAGVEALENTRKLYI
jgi:hypothetical protein